MIRVKVLIEGYAKEIKGGWLASSTTTLIHWQQGVSQRNHRRLAASEVALPRMKNPPASKLGENSIEESGKRVIVDPGTNRKLLLKKLKEENLTFTDIDFVFMTHYHPDHNLLTGLFNHAKVLDDGMIYDKDKQTDHSGFIQGTQIKILKTPGHDQFHGSLVVDTKEGVIAVAGDVFWWSNEEKQNTSSIEALLTHKDPFVKDKKALRESRKKILAIADWIIPGHGKMFRNPVRLK